MFFLQVNDVAMLDSLQNFECLLWEEAVEKDVDIVHSAQRGRDEEGRGQDDDVMVPEMNEIGVDVTEHAQSVGKHYGVGEGKTVAETRMRKKGPCPLPHCRQDEYARPTKHLMQYHRMTADDARLVTQLLKDENSRKGAIHTPCPFCPERCLRLDQHLVKKHRISRKEAHNHIRFLKKSGRVTKRRRSRSRSRGRRRQRMRGSSSRSSSDRSSSGRSSSGRSSSGRSSSGSRSRSSRSRSSRSPCKGERRASIDESATPMKQSDTERNESRINERKVGYIFRKFRRWLQVPEGGSLSELSAADYTRGARNVLMSLGGRVSDIVQYRKIGLPGGYLEMEKKKGLKATSRRNGIYGFIKLLQYIQLNVDNEDKKDGGRERLLSGEQYGGAEKMLRNYAASLRGEIKLQRQERKETVADEVERLKPMMAVYGESEHAQKARKVLYEFRSGESGLDVCEKYVLTRDYIITRLLLVNGQRLGPIVNATVNEFEQNRDIAKVKKHKTDSVFGWARLVCSEDLRSEVDLYLSVRREFLDVMVDGDRDKMFVSRYGRAMTSRSVNEALTRSVGVKASATTMRMGTVCIAKDVECTDMEMSELADLMCHQQETQQQFYDVRNKDRRARQTTALINENLEKYKVCMCSSMCVYMCVCVCVLGALCVGWMDGWMGG